MSNRSHIPTPTTDIYVGRQLQDRPEWVDACVCLDFERDNAALLEENARLKRHAEAMAEELRTLPFAERVMNGTPNRWWQSLEAYRADFPKEAP